MAANRNYPAIPQPSPGDPDSLYEAVSAVKENVELLTGQRGTNVTPAVTWQDLVDLGLIAADQVPR